MFRKSFKRLFEILPQKKVQQILVISSIYSGLQYKKSSIKTQSFAIENRQQNVETISPENKTHTLYPEIEPYNSGFLQVSDEHRIYFEECGNPQGKPVVFLHGGPGGGLDSLYRRFHNPQNYRIILFDQRGCGKSTPFASLNNNTTWDLVEDIEKLRKHCKVEKWQVFGGSWGSTLALAYSETHPDRVSELVLRGIFLLRKSEIQFFYQHGSSFIFPDYFDKYRDHVEHHKQHDLVTAYHDLLTGSDREKANEAARQWTAWEMATSKLLISEEKIKQAQADSFALPFAQIENHYFYNKGFFRCDDQLLQDVHKIRHIPTVIVQGRYDMVCPIRSAWDLHLQFPEAKLKIVSDAGHTCMEKGILSELVKACDLFSN